MKFAKTLLYIFLFWFPFQKTGAQQVSAEIMNKVYEEVKTPFKYGVIFKHPDSTKLIDSPSIFRKKNKWFMTYIVFDGRGYETWLAESRNLLQWKTLGKILSFTNDGWDSNQKAGYVALIDSKWGGKYSIQKYNRKYWMSYLGGGARGYEAGQLAVGMAFSAKPHRASEWERYPQPVLAPKDSQARWFENKTIFKSTVMRDEKRRTGHSFVMYYNASGDTAHYESIGMAVSHDMIHWERIGKDPVITRHKGICGDAQVARMNDLYVMFYFGAFWKPGAFERFACSYDLVNWTTWGGPDLVASSEDYDSTYAHKPSVIKWKGVVYHFYNAVGKQGRVIALATSRDLKYPAGK